MARPLRIQYAGAWYHVMNRGLNRRIIFHKDEHHKLFLELLADIHQRFGVQIHAYCLMSNHYHLLLHTPNGNLSRAMRHLDGVYTQKFNKSLNRDGPLFRGRYKSILIDADDYLLQVSRYIHLNPVVANLVELPEHYLWSSYCFFLNLAQQPPWFYREQTLSQISVNDSFEQYKQFVEAGIGQASNKEYFKSKNPSILGKASFIESIKNKEGTKITVSYEIPATKILKPNIKIIFKRICNELNLSSDDLKKPSHRFFKNPFRDLIIFFLSTYFEFSHRQIAELIGNLKSNGVSKIKMRMKIQLKANISLQEDLKKLKNVVGKTYLL